MKRRSSRQQNNAIAPKQIQLIKIAQSQLGMDDVTYRALLQERYGVNSCTGLTLDQANELIDDLQQKGFALKPKKKGWREVRAVSRWAGRAAGTPRAKGNLIALASADELAKVDAVTALIAWRVENGLQLFLEKRMGIKGGRVRTAGEAYKAIEGLKKMFENGQKSYYGENWWSLRFDDEAVEEYINRHAPAEFRDLKGKVYKR